jgi:hypothetical protein
MLHPSNLDDRIINSLKSKLISLENSPNSGFTPNIAVQMLSLHPVCLLKGLTIVSLPDGLYKISDACGALVANCKTAVNACERLSDSYMTS